MSVVKVPVSVLRTCLVQAVRNAQALALRLVQSTEAALQQADAVPQLSGGPVLRAAAYQSLLKHRSSLVEGYPQALLEALVQAARQPFSFSSAAIDGDVSQLASFVHRGESAQRQSLLRQRLQQDAALQAELALADLDSLVSAAQGMARVQPESNPLKPENYLLALTQVIAATQVDAAVAECWLECMGHFLGSLLVPEYARAAAMLREQGVVPARYGVPEEVDSSLRRSSDKAAIQRSRWQAPVQYGDAMGQSRAYASQHEDLLTLRVLQDLISDQRWIDDGRYTVPQALTDSMLAGSSTLAQLGSPHWNWTDLGDLSGLGDLSDLAPLLAEPDALQAGWTSYSATALETIQHHPTQVAQLFKAVEPVTALSPHARTLQRMMVHMTGDARLQSGVQRVLRYLEPLLMQLVERDGRFFEDSQHPARQLLDELTARSLWFSSESTPGFAQFIQVTEAAAAQLASVSAVDAHAFAVVLQRMREGWTRFDEGAPLQQPALAPAAPVDEHRFSPQTSRHGPLSAALNFADQHPSSAQLPWSDAGSPRSSSAVMPDSAHIAQAITRLPSAQGVPEDILDFVTGPWAHVIARAQQLSAQQPGSSESDPGGYLALVPSLLWSVSAHACTDVRRLAMLAPRLQTRLANGLRSVGRTEAEIQGLAARLAGLHQDALDTGLTQVSPRLDATDIDVLDMLPSMLGSFDDADETKRAPLRFSSTSSAAHSLVSAKDGFKKLSHPAQVDVQQAAHVAQVEVHDSWGKSAVAQSSPALAAIDMEVASVSDSAFQSATGARVNTETVPDGEWALGCWVELVNERQQLRTRLTWVSPQQTLFLFTAVDGSTQSMTRRMRDKLLAQGQLKRVNGD